MMREWATLAVMSNDYLERVLNVCSQDGWNIHSILRMAKRNNVYWQDYQVVCWREKAEVEEKTPEPAVVKWPDIEDSPCPKVEYTCPNRGRSASE